MKQSRLRRKDCNYRDQPRKRAPIDFMVMESMKVWAAEKAPATAIMRDQKAPCKKCCCPDYSEERI